ncbi:MAG: SDR family oxidoreductase [Acidobacteriota bacterium]
MRFAGKGVLVTGGSGGIGGEICRRFAAEGARVFVHYSGSESAARETVEALEGDGHRAVRADLLEADQVAAMVDSAEAEGEGLDILVNNAGIFEPHPPLEVDFEAWQEAWRRTLGINLIGAANACHSAARHMVERGRRGRIVNVSSRGAFRGEPECPAYGASKAGLNALSQSLAQALGPHGIGVFAVAPGFVETAMARPWLDGEAADAIRQQSPLGRVARVSDVAYWVLCAADPQAEFATGAILDVNGASYLRS